MKLTPNITLSTGRIITHAFMTNGAQSANILGDESATMTEAEWDEYCELLKGVRNPPVTHVRSCDNCGSTLTDPDEMLCEKRFSLNQQQETL